MRKKDPNWIKIGQQQSFCCEQIDLKTYCFFNYYFYYFNLILLVCFLILNFCNFFFFVLFFTNKLWHYSLKENFSTTSRRKLLCKNGKTYQQLDINWVFQRILRVDTHKHINHILVLKFIKIFKLIEKTKKLRYLQSFEFWLTILFRRWLCIVDSGDSCVIGEDTVLLSLINSLPLVPRNK